MLISILRCLLVRRSRDIQQAIDTRLDGINALIPELKRLPGVSCVLVDHAIDELLYGCHILRGAELTRESVNGTNTMAWKFTSRMLSSMLDPVPVSASKIGFTEPTKCFNMMTWLMACSVVCKVGLVGVIMSYTPVSCRNSEASTVHTAVNIRSASRKFLRAIAGQSSPCFECDD
jgi:hypothetical protein